MKALYSLPLIECVPNFSVGNDHGIIKAIADAVERTAGVHLLGVQPGAGANRTVYTFAGAPENVINAAYNAIEVATDAIDMRLHKGVHPRIGATDVCPFVPICNIAQAELVPMVNLLAQKVGEQLHLPIYMYEAAAKSAERSNLSNLRIGGYEAIEAKMAMKEWMPDYGPYTFNARSGATVMGVRDYLVAYNIDLNTADVKTARQIAQMVRESGYTSNNEHHAGLLQNVKSIGWYIPEYGRAQVSANLTNFRKTGMHIFYDAVCKAAKEMNVEVMSSELIGLAPLKAMIDSGMHYMENAEGTEEAYIASAIKGMKLNVNYDFDPKKRILEYALAERGINV